MQQVPVDSDEVQRDSSLGDLERARNSVLRHIIRKRLQGKQCFIVLDDMPRQMRLEYILEDVLPQDVYGSTFGGRLLLTSDTQNTNASVNNVHEVQPLDSDKSWKLFLKTINRVTNDENKFPKHLESQGKQMLTKCGGLPLAIKDVAIQFARKRQAGIEWEELLNQSVDLSSTLQLLEPFYQKMDPTMKSCFLHMAFFKENITIHEKKLTHILAAGVVLSKYEIYDHYFTNFINESILQVKDKNTEYRLNVVLRRLSIKKAEEEIGFEILSNNDWPSRSARHRVIICSRDKFKYSMNLANELLVSLFFHGGGYFNSRPSYWKSLKQLRILDFEDFGLKSVPEIIGSLMELRYLGLRNNYIKELPDSLWCLKKLEVLDIALNFMVEVPYIILEMVSLRHLYMSSAIFGKPLKKEKTLEMLETLTYVSVNIWTYELSDMLSKTNLRKLGIEELDGNSNVRKLFASLQWLKHLESVVLRGYHFVRMPRLDELGFLQSVRTLRLDGLLHRLPNRFPPNIEHLKLINSSLEEDPMPQLLDLNLRSLKLRNAYTGQQMMIFSNGFFMLQHLIIEELWNLRNIQVEEYDRRRLEVLEIKNCPYLESLPKEIRSMHFLKKLKIVTTINTATKIKKSTLISKMRGDVDIDIRT